MNRAETGSARRRGSAWGSGCGQSPPSPDRCHGRPCGLRGDGQPPPVAPPLPAGSGSARSGPRPPRRQIPWRRPPGGGVKACLFLGLFEDGVDAFLLVLGVQIVLHALHSACWCRLCGRSWRRPAPCRNQSSGCSGRRAGRSGWTGWRWPPAPRSSGCSAARAGSRGRWRSPRRTG